MKKKNNTLFNYILLVLNIIVVVFLILSYISTFISPEKHWSIALIGLAYPILAFINMMFVLIWIIKLNKYCLISIIALILGWNTLNKYISFNNTKKQIPTKNVLKVMSYNVRNFDLYNYLPHWQLNFKNRNKIYELLTKESPDIICFQEFVHDAKHEFKTDDTIAKQWRKSIGKGQKK